ncbi:hypothetical protein GQX74_012337 [Glossina fuscipes]|nr:hypothetical protein GQX74_012337 [Glossina fuscipes]
MSGIYSRRPTMRPEKLEVNWKTTSPFKHERENLIRCTHLLKEYMDALEIPGWYRGLAPVQLSKVRELSISLHDDNMQETTYRTRAILSELGLYPIPSDKLISQLIKVSGASDFAFLWFLMEAAYHGSDEQGYNINEQIILSCITDMDLPFTLNALDKLLPPATMVTKRRKDKPKESKISTTNCINFEHKYPYFAKQRLPVLRKSNFHFCRSVKYTLERFNKNYGDAQIGDKWMLRRWFKDYKFNATEHITHAVIRDKINDICDDFDSLKVNAEKLTLLCKHHEEMRLLEEAVEAKLKVIEKEHIDNDHVRKEKLLESLQKEIEENLKEFRESLTKCRRQTIMKILANDTHKTLSTQTIKDFSKEITPSDSSNKVASSGYDLYEEGCMMKEDTLSSSISSQPDSDFGQRNSISIFKKKFLNLGSYCGLKRFHCRSDGTCQFDYRKIFEFKENSDENLRMKRAFIDAVDSDIALLNELEREWMYCQGYDKAVSRTAEKIWNKELERYQMMVDEQLAKCPLGLEYQQTYYDPNDDELMERMLKDAIDYLRKDPQYVLLSLPGVHRLPILKEWIRLRYGKVYTCKEQRNKLQRLQPILNALPAVTNSVDLPTVAQVHQTRKQDYTIRDILIEKSRALRCNIYEKMDQTLLAQTQQLSHSLVVRTSDTRSEDSGSIPGAIAPLLLLIDFFYAFKITKTISSPSLHRDSQRTFVYVRGKCQRSESQEEGTKIYYIKKYRERLKRTTYNITYIEHLMIVTGMNDRRPIKWVKADYARNN